MHVTRGNEAKDYEAPGHHGVQTIRLQGAEASPVEAFSLGISHFEPGGGADMSATPMEKVYYVIEGEITIELENGSEVLKAGDSCYLPPNEARAVKNNFDGKTTMLVAMTYPPAS
jgi:quercetin dioxygenase-like cupin family protein